ncbi:MAG TPA: hypothetical protein VHZ95_19045 [Polyangiales bacterium]|nr:hypothetical protein [Polyangiales bacterium]
MTAVLSAFFACASLDGCTGGVAKPVYALEIGAQSGAAGRTGDSAGHAAAGSGDAGVHDAGAHDAGHDPMKSACETAAPPWSAANADYETALLVELNEAIASGVRCGDHAFMRDAFASRGDLTCFSRYAAFSDASGAPWGRPSGQGQGPGRDPFQAPGSTDQITVMGMTTTDALTQLFSDGGACSMLMTTKYTAAGVGHYDDYWVITLGSD